MDRPSPRFPELPAPEAQRLPAVLRDPLRLSILAGLLVMLIGDVMPWFRLWLPGRGFFDVSGFERAGDAGLVLELGLVILVLTWADQAWNSRTTLLVAGPLLLGTACVIVLRVAWAAGMSYIRSLAGSGGYGSVLPWFWLAVAGAIIVTVGGAIALWRARGRLSFRVGVSRVAIGGAIGGVAGAIGGFFAGVQISDLMAGDDIAWVSTSLLVLLSIALGFVGAWIGAVIGAGVARSFGGR
ncbi:MAG TPA: hypothetical protein VFX65_04515 [Candidatus Limnocylindrales bacterium]|nr:hypothetical protein [Candidatus Limnocylindrales bacterium]